MKSGDILLCKEYKYEYFAYILPNIIENNEEIEVLVYNPNVGNTIRRVVFQKTYFEKRITIIRKCTSDEYIKFEHLRDKNSDVRKVNLEWLKNKCKQLVKKHWDLNYQPNILLYTLHENPRGLACYNADTRNVEIREELLEFGEYELELYLLHELCHWYLHITGQKWRDRDIRFAYELIRVGTGQTYNYNVPEAAKAYELALQQFTKENN